MGAWVDMYLAFFAWWAPLSLVFCLLEYLSPVEALSTRRNRLPNWIYIALALPGILFLQFLFTPAFVYLADLSGGKLGAFLYMPSQGIPGAIAFALAFAIVWDLWEYSLHRLQHASPLLWETHRFHHSDEAVNATTAGRRHLLSHVLSLVWHAPIVLLFGTLNPHAVACILMFRCWGFVNHANVRISFGPLTGIIAGPQWHRIHHSIDRRHRDRNFATFFPFIDRLFGTYYAPAVDEYPATGLSEEERQSFAKDATFAPLANWFERVSRSMRRATKRLHGRRATALRIERDPFASQRRPARAPAISVAVRQAHDPGALFRRRRG